MQKRIFLIGFMGSGKTTHGKILARKLGYRFVDMDHWIEEHTGKTVPEIFEQEGESFFRAKETEAIEALSHENDIVISTGGGAPCHADNMELLNSSGLTIYLQLPPGALLNRLKSSRTKRPLLTGKSENEMRETITDLLTLREPYYKKAAVIVDGMGGVDERLLRITH